jgi:hypothetical protein
MRGVASTCYALVVAAFSAVNWSRVKESNLRLQHTELMLFH